MDHPTSQEHPTPTDVSSNQESAATGTRLVSERNRVVQLPSSRSLPKNEEKSRIRRGTMMFLSRANRIHKKIPYVRRLPLSAVLIIILLIIINLTVWAICALILTRHHTLLGTAALAYSLGLRHALDADHISAIDLMTRRLIASGHRPVTVGTFFSLGHSTIVVVTSIVVAATAAGVSDRFGGFGNVGGIIGTSVSAAFLILLGVMNAYILYKLIRQLQKVIKLQPDQESAEGLKVEGGGVLFRILKRMFKLIDRPWKMYPLGVLFGLGFDTSSEVALLGISSIQGAKGTSMWLILVFPVLFTVGMCLIDTIDGALMMSLYVAPIGSGDDQDDKKTLLSNEHNHEVVAGRNDEEMQSAREEGSGALVGTGGLSQQQGRSQNLRVKSPLTFLYYSSVLTLLTVIVALVIGTIQLLSLILNVAVSEDEATRSRFWRGVAAAGDHYDIIGGAICGAFVIFGGLSVVLYRPFRHWVDQVRANERIKAGRGSAELVPEPAYRDPIDDHGPEHGEGSSGSAATRLDRSSVAIKTGVETIQERNDGREQ